MVDQTPVLDIKPYIPQYDNPNLVVQAADNISAENISSEEVQGVEVRLNNTSLNDPGTASSSGLNASTENLNMRTLDGEENSSNQNISSSQNASFLTGNANESFFNRSGSRMGEREAPDGEEEESPRQLLGAVGYTPSMGTSGSNVRIPSWIDNPPVNTLTVLFKERALLQLQQLGPEV